MGDAGKTVTGLLEGLRNGESAEVAGTSGAPD
jgi:hypothetical protein